MIKLASIKSFRDEHYVMYVITAIIIERPQTDRDLEERQTLVER